MARAVTDPAEAKQPTPELRDQARALSGLALDTLADIMRGGGQDTVKLAAAREILDRAHGKAKAVSDEPAPEGLTVVIRRFGDEDDAAPSAPVD